MSHNFNWVSIPDSSKLREQDDHDFSSEDQKFYFGDYSILGKFSEDLYDPVIITDSIEVSLADINNLNIVINDNECSNSFIESICQQLDMDGIRYSFSRQEDGLDVENAVVITLDQQYVSGPRVCVIGAYENNRGDNSDGLALAMDTAFRAGGVDSDGIFCGKRGYRQDNLGISTRVPTPTEEAILVESNTSFVTIAFGTNTPSAEEIAGIIEDGLGRYVAYISRKEHGDLIYRAEANDTIDSLAEKFGTAAFDVSNLNNIDNIIPSDEAIINPLEYNSPVFDKSIPVSIKEIVANKTFK